jgi:uncharacterized OB-fold protein
MTDLAQTPGKLKKPLPQLNRNSRPFWDAVRRNEFLLPKCEECGHRWFPPQPSCPNCLSFHVNWKPAKETGKIWSKCRFHHVYFKSFAEDIPYSVVTVQLDESGIFFTSNLLDVAYEGIEIGMPVRIVYDVVDDGTTLIKFVTA